MKLNPGPFAMIGSGKKTIELRLYDEKRQQLRIGDTIVFTNTATEESMQASVQELHVFPSFAALYDSLPLLQCGYTEDTIADAKPSDMAQYYTPEEEANFGVVGIALSLQ